MPELPEVETVRLALSNVLLKDKILKISIKTKKLRFYISNNLIKNLQNQTLTLIERRGKYLVFNFDNGFSMLVHLGMTGVFRVSSKNEIVKHDHLIFFFKDLYLIFNDVRKFGFIKLYKTRFVHSSKHLILLGPEPFDKKFNFQYVQSYLKKSKTNIKNVLMNQFFVAGLGNIYCSEVLYDCKLSPLRKVNNINSTEIKNIILSIKKVLKKAIRMGGTSIRNYINPDGKLGYFKNELMVYGRENKNCFKCKKKSIINKITQQGRSTFYCKLCQK